MESVFAAKPNVALAVPGSIQSWLFGYAQHRCVASGCKLNQFAALTCGRYQGRVDVSVLVEGFASVTFDPKQAFAAI
jgi:hypothetical protein